MAEQQITLRAFKVRKSVTGMQVLLEKGLRVNGMDNKEAEAILQSSDLKNDYINRGLFPCWVPGTIVAYPKRGDKLTETIVFDEVKYKVPQEILQDHYGEKNMLLVLQRDFDIEKFVINGKVAKVLRLPERDCWGMPDEETGIPQGTAILDGNPHARFGVFRNSSAYIGPLVRDCVPECGRYLFATFRLADDFSVCDITKPVNVKLPETRVQVPRALLVDLRRLAETSEANLAELKKLAKLDGTVLDRKLLLPINDLIRTVGKMDVNE